MTDCLASPTPWPKPHRPAPAIWTPKSSCCANISQRVAHQVLTDYPDHVDTAKVGNWQLLATIDALIKNEKTAANYHFAWFQALNLALKGELHR